MSATVLHDEKIATAASVETSFLKALETARAHRERVREHILATRGRAFAGELEALPDLDQLHQDLITAEHAIQDGELELSAAQAELRRVLQQRPAVEGEESAAHLAALLGLRSAWAAQIDAAIEALVVTARAYLVTARECRELATSCGIAEEWGHDPAGPLVDRVTYCLKTVAPKEFSSAPPRPPMVEADQELSKRARARVLAAGLGSSA